MVDLELTQGNKITSAQIWNEIKALDAVTQHGYKSSYKHFSPAQYREAKAFLEIRIMALEVPN
ncbi:MAG: hypothetical protein MRY79_08910 [Alphaproteobacteria bacterium]|nr:hypothetical protein [Alphaproteobacteria bacterium]